MNLVGSNRHPHAAVADQDAALGLPLGNLSADLPGVIRVIRGFGGRGAKILHLVALLAEFVSQQVFKIEPRVV